MPIIHGALHKLHVNGSTKLKLYSYVDIGKYLGEWGVSSTSDDYSFKVTFDKVTFELLMAKLPSML